MKSKFPGAVPEIAVRDINEAAAYYESNLGFTVDWVWEDNFVKHGRSGWRDLLKSLP